MKWRHVYDEKEYYWYCLDCKEPCKSEWPCKCCYIDIYDQLEEEQGG
jgi:hypothetical protein